MLSPIDFLHSKKPQEEYLLNPSKIHEQKLNILEKDEEWSNDDNKKFALLNRLMWTLSILDTVDGYSDYSTNDILTFFVAFNTFCDIVEEFDGSSVGSGLFQKSANESIFTDDIVRDRSDKSFISFIRSLSFAHTTGVNRGGKFLKNGVCSFVLSSIDTESAVPTNDEIIKRPEAFYFHVIVLKDNIAEPKIFKVFIDELKSFLKECYDNCSFEKLEEENG